MIISTNLLSDNRIRQPQLCPQSPKGDLYDRLLKTFQTLVLGLLVVTLQESNPLVPRPEQLHPTTHLLRALLKALLS